MSETSIIEAYKKEINAQLSNAETMRSLISTTFNDMEAATVKRAMLEGYMRGFTLNNFLKKDVYAIPFKNSYSLVTSIYYARKIGQSAGIVGKEEPKYTEDKNGNILTCSITLKKKTGDYIGNFSSTVYFKEYSTGKQQWATKPRTMIAKVAEMHALRMACPEEAQQMYAEEEMQMDVVAEFTEKEVDTEQAQKKLMACKNMAELQTVWLTLSAEEQTELEPLKNEIKEKLAVPEPPKEEMESADDLIEGEVVAEETNAAKAMREAKEATIAKK